jgi:ATP-dependent Clp protease ATP-binding subunit ClpA
MEQPPSPRSIDADAMARALAERVPGQEYVTQELARLTRRHWAKERQPHPILSVLFLGPQGLGKTELARAFADYLFGSNAPIIEYDCIVLNSFPYASNLIGPPPEYDWPPRYENHERGGLLTRPIIENPKRVLLLENISYAGSSLIDLVVQILDEGRVIETTGNVADFTESVLILTSCQDEEIEKLSGEIVDDRKRAYAVKSHLSASGKVDPEIVWRLDRLYVFRPLSDEAMIKVIIQKFRATARELNLELVSVDPGVVREVFERCHERRMFGAITCATEILLVEYFRATGNPLSGQRVCIGMGRDGLLSVNLAE